MSPKRRLRSKVFLAFVLPAAVAVAGSLGVLGVLGYGEASAAWVTHTHEVIAEANALVEAATRAQSGLRGFVISGDESFLDAYDEGLRRFPDAADRLRALLSGNPPQVERLEAMHRIFRDWEEGNARPQIAERRRTPGPLVESLRQSVSRGVGKAKLDSLRDAADVFVTHQQRLLEERVRAREATFAWIRWIALLAPGLAVVLALVLVLVLVLRTVSRLESVARAADALAEGRLDSRAHVSGIDEIGGVADAFNRMAERLQHNARTLEALRGLTDLLQASRNPAEAHAIVAAQGDALFPGSSGAVLAIGASRRSLEVVASWGPVSSPVDGGGLGPDACWALRRGRAHASGPGTGLPPCPHAPHARASLCVPLLAHGESMGSIHLAPAGDEVSPDDGRLAETVAEQLGLSLANLHLQASLREQSVRDALTGLFNRRYLQETAEREIRRAARARTSLALIVFDVDHFKQFNDRFGHDAGDEVLRELARFLQENLRASDVACRFGGEEFVLLVAGSTASTASALAEKLRLGIEQLAIHFRKERLGPVTVSMGIAAFPEHGADPDALFAAADQALYRAKSEGRNRVLVSEAVARPV